MSDLEAGVAAGRSNLYETQFDGNKLPGASLPSSEDERDDAVSVGNSGLFPPGSAAQDEWFGGTGVVVLPLTTAAPTPTAATTPVTTTATPRDGEWFGGSGVVVAPLLAAGKPSAPPSATPALAAGGKTDAWFGFDPNRIAVVDGKSPARTSNAGPPVRGIPPPRQGQPRGAVSGASSAAAHRSRGQPAVAAAAVAGSAPALPAARVPRQQSPTKRGGESPTKRGGGSPTKRGGGSPTKPGGGGSGGGGAIPGVRSAASHRRRVQGSGANNHRRSATMSAYRNRKYGTETRKQLDSIREHRPFFTYYMSFCQIVIMIVMLITCV